MNDCRYKKYNQDADDKKKKSLITSVDIGIFCARKDCMIGLHPEVIFCQDTKMNNIQAKPSVYTLLKK